mgnify:CR=1 FL=1
MASRWFRQPSILPGFGLTLGFTTFFLSAIVLFLFKVDIARLYLAIALPVGLIGLLVSRWLWRKVVSNQRGKGMYQTAVLIVGSRKAAVSMAKQFERTVYFEGCMPIEPVSIEASSDRMSPNMLPDRKSTRLNSSHT